MTFYQPSIPVSLNDLLDEDELEECYEPAMCTLTAAHLLIELRYLEERILALEDQMDKKMRKQIGKPLAKAEHLVKKAEKANKKLADYDEKVRDPMIEKYKKIKKK